MPFTNTLSKKQVKISFIGVLLANFAIDIAYVIVDPRTRLGMVGETA